MRCSVKRDVKDVDMYTVYCVYLYKCILHTIQIYTRLYNSETLLYNYNSDYNFFFTKYELSTDKPV